MLPLFELYQVNGVGTPYLNENQHSGLKCNWLYTKAYSVFLTKIKALGLMGMPEQYKTPVGVIDMKLTY